MKIESRSIERFLKAPDPAIRAILVYGPDEGLVRERAELLARNVVKDLGDPFRVGELTGAMIEDDPARLADEAAAIAFGGGRRVVRARSCGNGTASAFKSLLAAFPGDTLVVVEGGDLDGRSALRKLFDAAENAAALACYAQEGPELARTIRTILQEERVNANDDTLAYLAQRLGADRAVTRSELGKLATYVGAGGEASLEDARAVIGDAADIDLDDVLRATTSGDAAALFRALDRLGGEGTSAITVLRAAQRHFTRLHLCAGYVAAGEDSRSAMAKLRPPVFWKEQNAFQDALRRFPEPLLARVLSALIDAEIAAKSGGTRPALQIVERALLAIAARQPERAA
jgi:DNA polymerase-3 subunit delta